MSFGTSPFGIAMFGGSGGGSPVFGFRAEYAPGFSPTDLPTESDWEILGLSRQASWSRGRQDETDDNEPGKATVVIDDPDGEIFLDVLAGSIPPLTPFRIVIPSSGTDYVRFTGFMVDAPQPAGVMRSRTVTVEAIDWLGWASTVDAAQSKWDGFVGDYSPRIWLRNDYIGRLTRTGTSFPGLAADRIVNYGSLGRSGDLLSNAQSGYVALSLAASLENPVGGSDGMWVFGAGQTEEVEFSAGSSYTVLFGFRTPSAGTTGTQTLIEAVNSSGNNVFRISMNSSGHLIARAYLTTGASVTATVAVDHTGPGGPGDTPDPHLIVMRVGSSGNLVLTTDLGSTSTSLGGLTPRTEGSLRTTEGITPGGPWTAIAYFSDLAVLPDASFSVTSLADWVTDSGPDIWDEDTAGDRIARQISAAGHFAGPTVVDHTDASALSGPATAFGGSLASAIEEVVAERLGTAYIDVAGQLRARDFSSLLNADYIPEYHTALADLTDANVEAFPAAIAGVAVAGEEIAGGPDLPLVRRAVGGTTAGRLDRIINVVRIASEAGPTIMQLDADSVEQYGRQEVNYETSINVSLNGASLTAAALDLIDRRSQPSVEVGAVTVYPWESSAASEFVLTAELDSLIHYRESRPVEPAPGEHPEAIVNGAFRIQHESWSWGGDDLTVTYRISDVGFDVS